ncbi:transcriptional regulator, TetR family [Actinosynnema mirum DSM 43827]|uniref:Transcriptional regulator, TetR family n=1 Tax=Actinosynnema mirum (strain ATCC 29888 / DSM 43827 / JCM 3225 / NBRC 14064 / NCIMB 13271 / NRRL B-12336 / IMRU 3971 / 101) TaxID=446462 RepID=C6WGZ4_ACTMD|nr:transcriptional regulator, TetR family [Actinosynnema mirum DSM 43827]
MGVARLTRAQTQERTRAAVLVAARAEFAERGYRDVKVDAIAERAELTRGAVYSNFPGKRALYLAVLADLVERTPPPPGARPGRTLEEALGALARTWVTPVPDGIGRALPPELAGEVADVLGALAGVNAVLLGLATEALAGVRWDGPIHTRRVRLAELVLALLHGARQLDSLPGGAGAPGAYDVVSACERLAGLVMDDWWAPAEPAVEAREDDREWVTPEGLVDLVRGRGIEPGDGVGAVLGDGVVAVLGVRRWDAVERVARCGVPVTIALVTDTPTEVLPLVRAVVGELCAAVRVAFPETAWPEVRLVCDPGGRLATAAGFAETGDTTEAAALLSGGRVVATAEGTGAVTAVLGVRSLSREG